MGLPNGRLGAAAIGAGGGTYTSTIVITSPKGVQQQPPEIETEPTHKNKSQKQKHETTEQNACQSHRKCQIRTEVTTLTLSSSSCRLGAAFSIKRGGYSIERNKRKSQTQPNDQNGRNNGKTENKTGEDASENKICSPMQTSKSTIIFTGRPSFIKRTEEAAPISFVRREARCRLRRNF